MVILKKEEVESMLNFESVDGWDIKEEGEWSDEGKYSLRESILVNLTTGKHYSVAQSRSGSYFSDYHYDELCDITEEDEVVLKKITKEVYVKAEGNKVVLGIDADCIVHKVSRAAEHKVRWNNGLWSWYADENNAIYILHSYIDKLKEKLGADEVVMFLSSNSNFRDEIYKNYKISRKNSDSYEPLLKEFIRQYLKDNFNTFEIDNLEADDSLGIFMTNENWMKGYKKILCTIDKDLNTIYGWHYNLDKEELYFVDKEEADKFFFEQILTGDRTDDIPGCKGFGSKTARKLLDNTPKDKWWETVVNAYKKNNKDEEYALRTARLVRILTNDLYNKKIGVKLWLPLTQERREIQ